MQKAASITADNASKISAADVSREPFEVTHLTDKEKLPWKFLDEFKRKPQETRSAGIGSNLESPPASNSGGAHPAVEQTLQDVLEFGRLPKEFNNPATETEVAEQRLAMRVRRHHLRERAQEMLEKSKTSRDTSSGSSPITAGCKPSTASGGSHPAANLPHSAASATIQEPSPFLRKRLRQKTTVPHSGVQFAPTLAATSEAAKPSNKGTKRKMHDPDGLAHKPEIQNSGDVHLAAPASAMASEVSGKRKSCRDQHPAESQPLAIHRTQGSPGAFAGQPHGKQTLAPCLNWMPPFCNSA